MIYTIKLTQYRKNTYEVCLMLENTPNSNWTPQGIWGDCLQSPMSVC